MRAVVQRVRRAAVSVDGREVACIGPGLVILVGVARGDTEDQARQLAEQILSLRIFDDGSGKMNLSALETKAELLAVSQVTLCCDLSGGRRPNFDTAAPPDRAKALYETFVASLQASRLTVKEGIFRAMMTVSLENDGPVTFILNT